LHEEFLNLWINSLPYVSDEEMKDIQERYGSPNYTEDEFVEGDEWLGRRSSEKKS
jgi:HKD family nuclease